MKRIGFLLVLMFIGLGVWFAMTAFTQGSIWASNAYNTRLKATRAQRGEITDRNGLLLAYNDEDGNRRYLENGQARRALSQVVGDTAGMSGTGVETFFSSTLLDIGDDSLTERLTALFNGKAHTGSSIQLTIDAKLQAQIAGLFPKGYLGAVCVTNYRTGEILAMVSMPNYDPYVPMYRSDASVQDTAYLNRCLQGVYTPGSIFKIITLASALEADAEVANHGFSCSGTWKYQGGRIVCAGGKAHGELSLKKAFMKSCNVTFGKLAYQLGEERLRATAEAFGFNQNFKFGDFIVYNSSFPQKMGNASDLVWSGIGQSTLLVTPLHMNMVAGCIANGGVMIKPNLIRSVTGPLGVTEQKQTGQIFAQPVSASTAGTIAEYMYAAVQSGTAKNAQVDGRVICGKTGSAEISDDKSVETNAWFTGFIYDAEMPYAVSVVVEGGGAGGNMPSDLASKVFELLTKM